MNCTHTFTQYPRQTEFWNTWMTDYYSEDGTSMWQVIGYGGSRGGAKSYSVRAGMLLRRFIYPGTVGLIFRKTSIDLRENHIEMYLKEYPFLADFFLESKSMIRLPNGSRIVFLYGETDKDVERYSGHQYDDVCIDEASDCTPYMLDKLMAVCRRSSLDSPIKVPKTILTFNPGGPSHEHLKRLFVEKNNYKKHESPKAYKFIQSRMWDNYSWVADLPQKIAVSMKSYFRWTEEERRDYTLKYAPYVTQFGSMDDYMREAQIYGSWDTYAGQFLAKWNESVHVIPAFQVEPWWPKMISIDYGNQTACVAGTQSPDGIVYVTDELFLDSDSMGPRDKALKIAEWMCATGHGTMETVFDQGTGQMVEKFRQRTPVIGDVNLWYRDMRNGRRMPVYDFQDVGFTKMMPVSKRPTEDSGYRIICNNAVKQALYWEKDEEGNFRRTPKLFVFEGAAHELCTTLPLLMSDPARPEDFLIPKKAVNKRDHSYDALKYLLQNIGKNKEPKKVKVVDNPNMRAGYMEKSQSTRSVYA